MVRVRSCRMAWFRERVLERACTHGVLQISFEDMDHRGLIPCHMDLRCLWTFEEDLVVDESSTRGQGKPKRLLWIAPRRGPPRGSTSHRGGLPSLQKEDPGGCAQAY